MILRIVVIHSFRDILGDICNFGAFIITLQSYKILSPVMLPFRRLLHSRYRLSYSSNLLRPLVNSSCQLHKIISSGNQTRVKCYERLYNSRIYHTCRPETVCGKTVKNFGRKKRRDCTNRPKC
jgi:hypothetical protein